MPMLSPLYYWKAIELLLILQYVISLPFFNLLKYLQKSPPPLQCDIQLYQCQLTIPLVLSVLMLPSLLLFGSCDASWWRWWSQWWLTLKIYPLPSLNMYRPTLAGRAAEFRRKISFEPPP